MRSPATRPASGRTAAASAAPPVSVRAAEHGGAHAGLVAHGEGEVAQVVAGDAVDAGDHDAVDRRAGQLAGLPGGGLGPQRLELVAQRLELVEPLLDAVDHGVGAGAQELGGLGQARARRAAGGRRWSVPVTASMRRRFEPIEPSETILIGPMSPVARTWVPPHSSRLLRARLQDAHHVAVLVAEEGDGAHASRPRPWYVSYAAHRVVGQHLAVGQLLDALDLLGRDRRVVAEVEAQPVGRRRASPPASRGRPAPRAAPSAAGGCRCGCGGWRRGGRTSMAAVAVWPAVDRRPR